MKLFLRLNANNKFVQAYHAVSVHDVRALIAVHEPDLAWRQIGANSWQLGRVNPASGLLRPVQTVFMHEPVTVVSRTSPAPRPPMAGLGGNHAPP